ncbi:pseudouridine synthase [Hydrogenophaga sp. 5NK40-0174]|uniref:pseudouridine synthase n=1 Tax=Hydrogenophaga sp. 5NK40-0174 TaxID=3127649 RepID=UPI003340558D
MPSPPKGLQPWATVLDYLSERVPAVSRSEWQERFARGEVLGEDGHALADTEAFRSGLRVYYYRYLADETPVPFEAHIVFEDDVLLVADKPHFLPVLPGGRFVQETLLVRLKRKTGIDTLSPVHRIDRETAGLVVLSKRPEDRAAYQALFRDRTVQKRYQAVARHDTSVAFPQTRMSHLSEDPTQFFRMIERTELPPNSETHIERLTANGDHALYGLTPVTGRRHQLRVHMAGLGLPLLGDQFYPKVARGSSAEDDFSTPLRLLAQGIAFDDPVTGRPRSFSSGMHLTWPDGSPATA